MGRFVPLSEGKKYEITYAYVPKADALADEFDFDNGKINPRTVGYGIAAEYCIRQGESSDAVLWDARDRKSTRLNSSH